MKNLKVEHIILEKYFHLRQSTYLQYYFSGLNNKINFGKGTNILFAFPNNFVHLFLIEFEYSFDT